MNYDDYLDLYKTSDNIMSPDEEMAEYLNEYSNIPTDAELTELEKEVWG